MRKRRPHKPERRTMSAHEAAVKQAAYEAQRARWRALHPLVAARAWAPDETHPRYAEFQDREACP